MATSGWGLFSADFEDNGRTSHATSWTFEEAGAGEACANLTLQMEAVVSTVKYLSLVDLQLSFYARSILVPASTFPCRCLGSLYLKRQNCPSCRRWEVVIIITFIYKSQVITTAVWQHLAGAGAGVDGAGARDGGGARQEHLAAARHRRGGGAHGLQGGRGHRGFAGQILL